MYCTVFRCAILCYIIVPLLRYSIVLNSEIQYQRIALKSALLLSILPTVPSCSLTFLLQCTVKSMRYNVMYFTVLYLNVMFINIL